MGQTRKKKDLYLIRPVFGEQKAKKKTTMSVPEMRKLLGVGKTESYWLVHKNYFETQIVNGKMRIDIESFEKWYANQIKHKKVTGEEPGQELIKSSYSARDMANMLGVEESVVYDIWKRDELRTITVDYWKRIPKEEFERWYDSQNRYRTEEDKKRDADIEASSITMPEAARLLGLSRDQFYPILRSKAYKEVFEIVIVADRKRITRESFIQFLKMQNKYTLIKQKNKIKKSKDTETKKNGYLTREEAAELAGVSTSTITKWMQKERFPIVVAGKRVRIPKDDFVNWINKREAEDGID